MDTKTDFNLNNIIATLSLISISSVKKFAGKCPDTYSNLISTPLDGRQSLSIDAQSYPALTSQSLCATIGLLQDNWPLFHYVIGISGMLPHNRNVTLQTLELVSAYARLYNAAASPASRPRSADSLAINLLSRSKLRISATDVLAQKKFLEDILNSEICYCQRASRAKTRGWRGGSIIEPCIGGKKLEYLWGNIPVVR